ncbi:protein snakeskin-like [Artemia franciscana]|uniref:MARVEL domain-containing protein n=1 Tax=Artemia franciscana TaxID=6661 RepID=A0AA88I4R3_ARTSF|nr:hypothetical protein QYM36_003085 [Artemia franciscana]
MIMADLRVFARLLGFLKLAEILVSIICISLLRKYDLHFGGDVVSGSYIDRYMTGAITLGGFLMISIALLVSYVWGEAGTYQRFLELLFNFAATVMFLVSGILAIGYYNSAIAPASSVGAGRALGALCIINAIFYLIDTIIAYRSDYNA